MNQKHYFSLIVDLVHVSELHAMLLSPSVPRITNIVEMHHLQDQF